MPTYQYACTACGEELEAVQTFSDASLTECPACGGLLRKVFSAVGVVFKGSGFYKNDSRPASATSDKPAEKTSDAKADSGASSTPAKSDSSTSSTGSSTSTGSSSGSSGSSSSGSSGPSSSSPPAAKSA